MLTDPDTDPDTGMDIWEMSAQAELLELNVFWNLIEQSRLISKKERIPHDVALAQLLSLNARSTVARFSKSFYELSMQANNDKVYDVIGGSDDGFHYRISGLISMGQALYDGVISNPKKFKGPILDYEIFEYAAHKAFEEPSRSQLQTRARARHEQVALSALIPNPDSNSSKLGPRL